MKKCEETRYISFLDKIARKIEGIFNDYDDIYREIDKAFDDIQKKSEDVFEDFYNERERLAKLVSMREEKLQDDKVCASPSTRSHKREKA
mgnify:CR=1 FL=1